MSFVDRLISNIRVEFVGQIIAALSGALLIFTLTQLLTPDEYGLLYLALSITGTFLIFSRFGFSRSAARFISEYKEKKPKQVPYIIQKSLLYNLILIIVTLIFFLLSYQYITSIVDEPRLTSFLLPGLFYIIFGTLMKYSRFLLQGFESITYSATVNAVNAVARLIFAVGFVLIGFGALGAFGGYTLGFFMSGSIGLIYLYNHHYRNYVKSQQIEKGLKRRIAEYSIPITVTKAASDIQKRIDIVLIGVFLTPAAAGFYALGKQIISFVKKPIGTIGFALSPTFGAEKASGNIDRASRLYETTLIYSLLLFIPAAAGLIIITEPLVELIFGAEYLGTAPVLQILSIYLVLQAITLVVGNSLDYLGRARSRAIVIVGTSILNFILNVLLIPTIGIIGAASATVISYSIYTFFNLYIIYQELNLRIKYILYKVSLVILITGVMAVPVSKMSNYIDSIWMLFITIAIGILIWGILSAILGVLNPKKVFMVIHPNS